jgi:cob(I)alamin adenosyltransferase
MAFKIYTRTGDKGKTALIGGTKVPKSNIRIESYGTVDELNSFIGLLNDHLTNALTSQRSAADTPVSDHTPDRTTSNHPAAPGSGHTATLSDPATPDPQAAMTEKDLPPDMPASDPTSAQTVADHTPAGTSASSHSSGATMSGSAAAAQALPTATDNPATPDLRATVSPLLREIQDRLFTIGASLACDPEKESRMKIPDLKEEDIDLLEKEIDRMNEVLPDMRSFILPGGHVAVSTAHIARCVCRRAERICVRMQEEELIIEPVVLKYLNRLSDYLFVLARWIGQELNAPEIPWQPRISSGS